MTSKKANPFIQFYGEHNISPVHQDISNLGIHFKRREKLYRGLGMPPSFFRGRSMVEVGPGGGYNALAYFYWGAKVVFVEPNPKAQEELPVLLAKNGVAPDRWILMKKPIEDVLTDEKFDIVIAEGFIPGLYDRSGVVSALSKLTSPGGVVVVTCADDTSILFEHVKRLVAARLIVIQGAVKFEDQVSLLAQAFASHLAKLKYASRPLDDWVVDVLINPATYGNLFSIDDCINEFGQEFEVMAGSPDIFTDYSWYKDVDFDRNKSFRDQFTYKRHNLLLWDTPETIRDADANAKLETAAYNLRVYAASMVDNMANDETVSKLCGMINDIIDLTTDLDPRIGEALSEARHLISDASLNAGKVSRSEKLAAAFGRGQQYVSLVRKVAI